MLIALQLCVALVLTATLVTVVTVLAAFELGRLVTRDDEQREVDAADVPQSARMREAGNHEIGGEFVGARSGRVTVIGTAIAVSGRHDVLQHPER